MFHRPVLNIQNIHSGTRVGIEIEICIKKEKYDKIILKKGDSINNSEKHYEFKHANPFTAGKEDYLDNIILTVDPTCICKEGFVNAEIISPKMDAREIPIYFNFLKSVVFDNPDDFYQGETCGIHVHWSNPELMLNKDHKYLFLFFKLINNLRQKLDYKLINSHFSGRQFFYNKMYKDLTLSTNQIDKDDFFINYEYIDVKDVNTKSLEDILKEVDSTKVTVYRNISFTKEVFYNKILSEVLKNKRLSKLLYHFVCSNLNYFTGKNDRKVSFSDNFLDSTISEFENMDVDENIIEECIKKYLRIKLDFEYFKNSSEISMFKNLDEFLFKHIYYDSLFDESLTEDYFKFYNIMDSAIFYFINKDGNSWFTNFYDDFKEHFSKTKQSILKYRKYDKDELFDMIMMTQKKLPDISIYNITDGFHVEMRMFSLDSLLYGKTQVPKQNIINELTRFLLYTDNLMMNVISVLNHVYDSKNEIKKEKLTILEDTLLFGGRHSKNQVKKICRRLFSMDLVDRVTSRHLRSPVGKPGQSLKSHRKEKSSRLVFGKNNNHSLSKSKKKSSRRLTSELPISEENNFSERTKKSYISSSRRKSVSGKKAEKKSKSKSVRTKKKTYRSRLSNE